MYWLDLAVMTALAVVAYAYAGYPLLVAVAARVFPAPDGGADERRDRVWPSVTVVMTVHNEAGRVRAKLLNLMQSDYPRDRLSIIVVCDGSDDGTDVVVESVAGIRLLRQPERRGKASALNVAMAEVVSDVVVLCDVRQMLDSTAIRRLVRRLDDPRIGAVSGELLLRSPGGASTASLGLYWRYEKWIRESESRWRSAIGVTGALYAMRRSLFEPLPADTVLDDLLIPMRVARSGLRVVLERGAWAFDELQPSHRNEMTRKVRTLAGNFQAAAAHRWLLSPVANPLWFQFVSHKVLRLVVPYALLVVFVGSLVSHSPWMRAFGSMQLLFYLMGIAGLAFRRVARHRVCGVAAAFLALNAAAVLALVTFAGGRLDPRWRRT